MPDAPPRPGPLLKASLAGLVKRLRHLLERFEPDEQARTKIFRDEAVTGLQQFLDGVTLLPGLLDRPELLSTCQELREALRGVQPDELRQLPVLRETIAANLRHALNRLEPFLARRKEKVSA